MTRRRPSVAWRPLVAALALVGVAGGPACGRGEAGGGGSATVADGVPTVVVGSKAFTESVILGEILEQLLRHAGLAASHRAELGGTPVLFNALRAGDIDLYPEYTGTIARELLADLDLSGPDAMRAALRERGVEMSAPLGFNNSYAVGMREARAEELGIHTLSDLRDHPELRFGFSNEFMDRSDGWPALRAFYELPQTDVRGLDHDLAYRGLESGALDATDLYTTDAEIAYYHLRVLNDDRAFFPRYDAVVLYRADLAARAPAAVAALGRLTSRLDEAAMIAMNAEAKLEGRAEAEVAAAFLRDALGLAPGAGSETAGFWARLGRHTRDHLVLVAVSMAAAILVAVPLGILAARRRRLGQVVLGSVGVIQTIPSLALLVFMIPLLGIGAGPAIVALFLYSLLPIVRNTHAGLTSLADPVRESAEALGLSAGARLRLIELPLASRAILAGIKTAVVINIGTATLGALIGAGGYGQPILTGIRRDDVGTILEGAVPAALLALLVQGLFELAERWLVPRGLRVERNG